MSAGVADSSLARQRSWLDAGTGLFFGTLGRVPDDGLSSQSLLPGWSRAHVVSHLARNADALCNLLTWARTGVETPMYRNREARAADIEAGTRRPPGQLRADAEQAAQRLADAMASLSQPAWDSEVRTATGRAVPAREVVWMRVREVWVHAVDLDAGATFAAVPHDVAEALLDDALASIGRRPDVPAVTARCTESQRAWRLGDAAAEEVAGTYQALLSWALGRPGNAAAGWPALPAWL
jgi:maleylpyruvate isomerase